MTFLATQFFVYVCRSQCHPLIQANVLSDNSCFTDYNACPMVDVKIGPDLSSRIDVDSCFAVGIFGHHSGYNRDMEFVGYVSDPIDHDGIKTRIAKDDLFSAIGGRIAHIIAIGILD